MAIKEINHTKFVNLAIRETSSAAKKKIDQLTKKVENYFTNQQQQYNPIKNNTKNNYLKVAESEIIGTNHLGFAKFLFQQYSQQLDLTNNYYLTKSAFNFYVSKKITNCLRETVDIESARKNFYTELFQHTSLPRNYSFVPIIRKINQTIERYTQQQFFITYADKDKGRLQTPTVTPKQIQPSNWKKTQVELPTNLLYHYMPGSAINISSTDASTSNATSIFGYFPFQSKQRKAELANTFTTIKQEENKAVTTYLEYCYRNLHQIQAIDANYFTVAQILNQFICGLYSSILQHVHPMHSVNLQAAITNARDFEAAKLEANHVQAQPLYQPPVYQAPIYQLTTLTIYQPRSQPIYQSQPQVIYQSQQIQTLPQNLSQNGTQRPRLIQQNWKSSMVVYQPIPSSSTQPAGSRQCNSNTEYTQNLNSQNYLSLLITPKDTQRNNPETNQQSTLTSNIPLATITKNKSLDAIFPFELKKPLTTPLFSEPLWKKNLLWPCILMPKLMAISSN
ncbi:hypothetical protein G9A89_020807 [Geosiphon pyriformis]|nr:hypothetical protein G9A89_020807 [Geosiphon pyriformis]